MFYAEDWHFQTCWPNTEKQTLRRRDHICFATQGEIVNDEITFSPS